MLFSILSPVLPAKCAALAPRVVSRTQVSPYTRLIAISPWTSRIYQQPLSHPPIDTMVIIRYDMNEYKKLFIHIINMKEVTSVGQKTSIKNSCL